MKSIIFIALLFLSHFVQAQETSGSPAGGIQFEQHMVWQEVLQKATKERKYIFLDLYATWCGPCKIMDKQVYPLPLVAEYVNKHFVSVKIQMDSTADDSPEIRAWRNAAKLFRDKYEISAFPSFLFFSPSGEPLHKDIGLKNRTAFLKMAKDVIDGNPAGSYLVFANEFYMGKLKSRDKVNLMKMASDRSDDKLEIEVAKEYLHKDLNNLPYSQLLSQSYIALAPRYFKLIDTSDRLFKVIQLHPKTVDSLLGQKNYSAKLLDFNLNKYYVTPFLTHRAGRIIPTVEWEKLSVQLRNKFGSEAAKRNILSGKITYFRQIKDWSRYSSALTTQMRLYTINGLADTLTKLLTLNNTAFTIFNCSKNKGELLMALSWVDLAQSLKKDKDFALLDTKANILYKLGRRQDAIDLETEAVSMVPPEDTDTRENLRKMKAGLPTWAYPTNK